jgi:hypothetical protein
MHPAKLVLHFYYFSTILYGFYKKQESYFTIGVTLLQEGPREELLRCNVAPEAAGRRGWAKSGELVAGLGRGRTGEGLGVP